MKPDIYQIERIGSGSLSIMAKPVAGEWIDEEFSAIARWGISCMVSLLEEREAIELGLRNEQELALRYGMNFIAYPLPDRGLPRSVRDYLAFTRRLYHEASGGMHTVVHCRAGIGRTGLIAAGVLLHCGFAPLEAFQHISEKRGVSVPDTEEQVAWVVNAYEEMSRC